MGSAEFAPVIRDLPARLAMLALRPGMAVMGRLGQGAKLLCLILSIALPAIVVCTLLMQQGHKIQTITPWLTSHGATLPASPSALSSPASGLGAPALAQDQPLLDTQGLLPGLNWVMGLLGLSWLTSLYFGAALILSFKTNLEGLGGTLTAYAQGNLVPHANAHMHGEVTEIAAHVEKVGQQLSNIVSEIRSNSLRLSLTGEAVVVAASALQERTQEQSTHIGQTSLTIDALNQEVAQNACATSQLDEITRRLRQDAQASGQGMHESIHAISELESDSKRVSEIIGLIDNIAFQTNILALNAAIEAARAGELGRGFAVVAAEVRNLAQRSASAAADVRQIISRTQDQVRRSSARLQESGKTIDTLVCGVQSVSDASRSIADNSGRQSIKLQELADSVKSLESLTQQNLMMANESTAVAMELMDRAGSLSHDVAAIQLRQGSAEEARNLVDRAHALIQKEGLQGAKHIIHQPGSGFVDRDLYVFVTDEQGIYRIHAASPDKEGARVHDTAGIDGDAFVRDTRLAVQGNHWVDYQIVNPLTGLPQQKTSYVVPLDDNMVLGCGFYRHRLSSVHAVIEFDAQAHAPGASSASSGGAEFF